MIEEVDKKGALGVELIEERKRRAENIRPALRFN